jgi:hypothetical protein
MERKMAMVSKQISLKDTNQEVYDLEYWLSKTPHERLQTVTLLIRQNMDRTFCTKRFHDIILYINP